MKTFRYSIDRVSDFEWQIFDETQGRPQRVYLLYAVRTCGSFNVQFVLTYFDAIAAADTEWPTFDLELFSFHAYARTRDQFEALVHDVFAALQATDLNNPVELGFAFGGHVLNEGLKAPSRPHTH
jgi:hypothetical protein